MTFWSIHYDHIKIKDTKLIDILYNETVKNVIIVMNKVIDTKNTAIIGYKHNLS